MSNTKNCVCRSKDGRRAIKDSFVKLDPENTGEKPGHAAGIHIRHPDYHPAG